METNVNTSEDTSAKPAQRTRDSAEMLITIPLLVAAFAGIFFDISSKGDQTSTNAIAGDGLHLAAMILLATLLVGFGYLKSLNKVTRAIAWVVMVGVLASSLLQVIVSTEGLYHLTDISQAFSTVSAFLAVIAIIVHYVKKRKK